MYRFFCRRYVPKKREHTGAELWWAIRNGDEKARIEFEKQGYVDLNWLLGKNAQVSEFYYTGKMSYRDWCNKIPEEFCNGKEFYFQFYASKGRGRGIILLKRTNEDIIQQDIEVNAVNKLVKSMEAK